MQNLKRKITKTNRHFLAKLLTNQQFLSNFDKNNRLGPKKRLFLWSNKRHLRADVLSLLSSALRPRLLSRAGKPINYTAFSEFFIYNRGGKSSDVAKIVVMTTILSIFGLFSLNFATPVSAASLTLSVPTDALKLDLQPNDTFAKSSAGTVSVKTDALGGYTLSIKAKNSNELANGSNKISSITGNLTEDQYKASGNTNTWGYQPSKFNSNNNSAFLPGPTTGISTIEKTNAKNDTANDYNFVIGAKVDSILPNGSYSNTFIFTVTANTVSYSITYNLNDGAWNGTSPQTGNTVENTVKLDGNTPTKSGYEFKGWCDQKTSNENCGGTSYQPGVDFPLNNNDNTVTLWSMWKQAYLYMQDWQGCDQLETEAGIQLKDSRDGNIYTVAKLKDGNCWMTQNLRIQGVTLHTSDSNVTQDFILPSSDQESFNNTDYNKDSVYVNEDGGYYSWHAATAGTGNNTIYTGRATSSVCPKGWYLPNEAQYAELIKYYSDGTLGDIPANFSLSGYINNTGVLGERGTNGYYQTSYILCSNTDNYTLKLTISTSSSERRDMRYGNAMRCITGMGDEPSTASFVDGDGDDDHHDNGGTAWGGGCTGR